MHSLFAFHRSSRLSCPVIFSALLLATAVTACAGADDGQEQITWHAHVAPLIAKHCGSCHVDGGIAPFALDDYASVSSLATFAMAAIENDVMPPWGARETEECDPVLPFKSDTRLSVEEKQLMRDWIAAGTPEGDPATAASLPEPPQLDIVDPSVTMTFQTPYTVEGENDDFQCFVLDPGNTERVWVTEVQLVPDNRVVDHHGLVFLDFTGESENLATDGRFPCFTNPSLSGYLLSTWVPGAVPTVAPPDTGMPLPPGARIVVQMHYHPTGQGPEIDQSSVRLKWTTEQPSLEAAQVLLGNNSRQNGDGSGLQPGPNDNGQPEFLIPAGATEHTETMIFNVDLPVALPLYSVGTHMHYVGTDMKIDWRLPSGETQCLVQTPEWDFAWQRNYDYDAAVAELPTIRGGDQLIMRCTYNNSLSNPYVADALLEQGLTSPIDVHLGEQTLDEMCLGLFGILLPPGIIEQVF